MFISTPTNADSSSVKLTLKSLRRFRCSYTILRELTGFVSWSCELLNGKNPIQQYVVMVSLVVGEMWPHMQLMSVMNNMDCNKNMWHYKEFDKFYCIDWFDGLTLDGCVCVWCVWCVVFGVCVWCVCVWCVVFVVCVWCVCVRMCGVCKGPGEGCNVKVQPLQGLYSKVKLFLFVAWKRIAGVKVQLRLSLTVELDRGDWLTTRLSNFTPGIEPRYPLNGSLGRS